MTGKQQAVVVVDLPLCADGGGTPSWYLKWMEFRLTPEDKDRSRQTGTWEEKFFHYQSVGLFRTPSKAVL